jgi:hypothetical protein
MAVLDTKAGPSKRELRETMRVWVKREVASR